MVRNDDRYIEIYMHLAPQAGKTGTGMQQIACRNFSQRDDKSGTYQLDLPCAPVPVEALPAPRCTLAEIWNLALARGVAASAVARIEYYRSQAGPAWRFELPDGSTRFSVYGDCRRELSRGEASGSVP